MRSLRDAAKHPKPTGRSDGVSAFSRTNGDGGICAPFTIVPLEDDHDRAG
jgi:hypothetical protein